MTKERMIRVTRKDFFQGGMDDGRLIPNALSDIAWESLELVPPKDWRPDCFYLETHQKQEQFACKECPFRELEE